MSEDEIVDAVELVGEAEAMAVVPAEEGVVPEASESVEAPVAE